MISLVLRKCLIMNNQTIRITTAQELKTLIRYFQKSNIGNPLFFRGHSLVKYSLTPGITRGTIPTDQLVEVERKLYGEFYNDFRDNKIPGEKLSQMLEGQPELLSWYSVCLAQHLGLKTRLLDWSNRWETSLFFAVEDESKHGQDGSFWVFKCPHDLIYGQSHYKEFTNVALPEHNKRGLVNMPIFPNDDQMTTSERRINRQGGKFFTQPSELINVPMNEQPDLKDHLIEIIIGGSSKAAIKAYLDKFNQNREFNYLDSPIINAQVEKINTRYWN
jgi:hypothetical protein